MTENIVEKSFDFLKTKYQEIHYPTQFQHQQEMNKHQVSQNQPNLREEFEQFKNSGFCKLQCYDDFVCHTLFNNYSAIVEQWLNQPKANTSQRNSQNPEQELFQQLPQKRNSQTDQKQLETGRMLQQNDFKYADDIVNDELFDKLNQNQYLKRLCRSMFEAGYNFKKLQQ
ncbi:UNKNOWN [Stylonychia lemnae]|uniref:Uncharacterized protein n=1 Tax=Stylonychia lemnae TaxID=5949 RepID=A0A078A3W7_STYLE|nr:UNKNOWN [Stylonychia lemnae]|eukprot:CDW76564.1 UNKNOWN [Stylonychia lemnae]